MTLTAVQVKTLRPLSKNKKYFDAHGLYLLVTKKGQKGWRFKYHYDGKERLISLGTYPLVSLADARVKRDEKRRLLIEGIDPSAERQRRRRGLAEQQVEDSATFESVAREWLKRQSATWSNSTIKQNTTRLEQFVFPWLGKYPIEELGVRDFLSVLKRMEQRGIAESAYRVKALCSRVMKYAVATGRAERNPVADIEGEALPPRKSKNRPTITDERQIGELLRATDGYTGAFVTICALKLGPLLFVRPGELRHAEWREFDLSKKEWRIPAEKMKMGREHIVPLSLQALAILNELQPYSGNGKYVFPGARSDSRPMSENTINAALRRLDFGKDEICGHGFRAMASTKLHEKGWDSEVIERQLAHLDQNKVRAAYNHAQHLIKRKEMMQDWADYLDVLRLRTVTEDGSGRT